MLPPKLPRPSEAYRVLECPASVRMAENLMRLTTEYAEKGSAAHELAKQCLLTNQPPESFVGKVLYGEYETNAEICESVESYITYLESVKAECDGVGNVQELIEAKMAGIGTVDYACWRQTGTVHVVDYKDGVMPVSAAENAQMTRYAIGLLGQDRGIVYSKVVFHIAQPNRMDGVTFDRWDVPEDWFATFSRNLLEAATTAESEAPQLRAGDHCKFCPAKIVCPEFTKMREWAFTLGHNVYADGYYLPAPQDLTPEQISKALQTGDFLQQWLKDIWAYAFAKAKEGEVVEGYKLVPKQTRRKWKHEGDALKTLKTILEEGEAVTKKVITMPQAEKLLQKKLGKPEAETALEGLWEKPTGELTLVPITDKRAGKKLISTESALKSLISKGTK